MKKCTLKKICLLIIVLLIGLAAPVRAGQQWPFLSQALATKKADHIISESRLFPRTLNYILKYYVEPSRIEIKEMFKNALDDVQKSVPEILVNFQTPTTFSVTIDKAQKRFSSPLKTMDDFWKTMKEVFVFVELNYKGDVDLEDIEAIAINGALSALDPHSAFLTPEFYKEFKIDTGGEFGGLGIVITSKDGQLTVITPIEDTPAWKAGIKSGDIITQIDDMSTINLSLMKAVEKLRGKVGTKVTLMIERKGKAVPFRTTLTRARIHIDSVKSDLITDSAGTVGYIKLKRFQKDTAQGFFKELKLFQSKTDGKFRGLILDLRNNPGGLLGEAVDVADLFLPKGVIVSTVGANRRFIDKEEAHLTGTESGNYPIIVLINEGSASASEIVAGALQAHDRALIIGQKSFGKGSVQSVYELGKSYALKLTIAQYLTAGKHSIQTVGVTPDILLIPAIIDEEYLDIAPNKHSSEKELDKHLKQIAPISSSAKQTISYHKPYIDEDELEKMRQREYSSNLEFKDDFAVKLATKIILASTSSNPKTMLKEASPVIAKLENQEDAKISASLKKLGTHWTTTKKISPAKISATATLKQNEKVIQRARAGSEVDIVLSVNNLGKKTVERLIGVIKSDNPILDEKEFVFGKIPPQATLSRTVTIELPNGLNTRNIPYSVDFTQGDKKAKYTFKSSVNVTTLAHPKFSFNYQLEAPKTVGAPHPLPLGKNVPLTVKIKNIGKGPTNDLQAYITNKDNIDGLFIDQGRIKIGELKPGETKKISFTFKVQPNMKNSTFILDLTITDNELLEFINTNLVITMQSGKISPPEGIWYEGPVITVKGNVFPVVTSENQYKLKGTVTDRTAVKDYYIFVNEKKVAYRSNPKERSKLVISETLTLEKGNNNITIIARDINNISTRHAFVVQKGQF